MMQKKNIKQLNVENKIDDNKSESIAKINLKKTDKKLN